MRGSCHYSTMNCFQIPTRLTLSRGLSHKNGISLAELVSGEEVLAFYYGHILKQSGKFYSENKRLKTYF